MVVYSSDIGLGFGLLDLKNCKSSMNKAQRPCHFSSFNWKILTKAAAASVFLLFECCQFSIYFFILWHFNLCSCCLMKNICVFHNQLLIIYFTFVFNVCASTHASVVGSFSRGDHVPTHLACIDARRLNFMRVKFIKEMNKTMTTKKVRTKAKRTLNDKGRVTDQQIYDQKPYWIELRKLWQILLAMKQK